MKNYKKAARLAASYTEKTALAKCENDEQKAIVQKIFGRKNRPAEISVGDFCRKLVLTRLQKIADAMPDEGYSMGSRIRVSCAGLMSISDRTKEYANSCKYKPTYGGYFHKITIAELKKTHVIGGLVTVIEPGQKSKVKKCFWYTGKGSKNRWELIKETGFVYAGFHAKTKEGAKIGGERNLTYSRQKETASKFAKNMDELIKKAAKKQYSFSDSILAGNCEAGTRAFILRCGLDSEKKYRGTFLLQTAEEKSSASFVYVKRMIEFKAKSLVK